MQQISPLADPCPLPSHMKKRSLNEKDKLLYAPMSDIGNVIYDNDVVYINVPQSQNQNRGDEDDEKDEDQLAEGEMMLKRLQNTQAPLDELLEESEVKFFGRSKASAQSMEADEDEEDESGNDDMSEDDDDEGEEGIEVNEERTKTSKMPWQDDEEEGNENLQFEDENEGKKALAKSEDKRQLSIVSEWESKLNLERSGAASLTSLIYGQPTQPKGAHLSPFVFFITPGPACFIIYLI